MQERKIGIRQLKANLSACLKEVKAGRVIVITERGKPVGRISPIGVSLEDTLQEGIRRQLWSWSGKKWQPKPPRIRPRGKKLVSELLLEDRD